MLKRP